MAGTRPTGTSVSQTSTILSLLESINICMYYNKMSLLPIAKLCKNDKVVRLFTARSIPKHSPVFSMTSKFEKMMGISERPTCIIVNATVIAARDLTPGMPLTRKPEQ